MTLASDQALNSVNLSPTSQRIELRDAVLNEWEKRVRELVKESSNLPRPLLVNTLPSFYDNIAQAVTQDYSRLTATEGTTLAAAHGSQRARMSNLDAQALINEYHILRRTIADILHENGVQLSHHESLVINASIEAGIREAVHSFSLVHAALRERFIAALAHDLRGPLHTAKMVQELILMGTNPAKMKSFAVKAIDNLQRMDGMIADLLDSMAAKDGERVQLELTQFDIAEVVKEVQVEAAATHHHAHFQILGGIIIGWWDRKAVKRVIENLVSNAVKYGDTDKPIRISFAEAYERLVLMVHNQGQPIPPEEQENVFQIFRRSQAAQAGQVKGWGIGLPFVQGVVESHGGSIVIDSTVERGTTFTIDMPLDSRPFDGAPTTA